MSAELVTKAVSLFPDTKRQDWIPLPGGSVADKTAKIFLNDNQFFGKGNIFGPKCVIDEGSSFGRDNIIRWGVKVGSYCSFLNNVTVGDWTTIGENCSFSYYSNISRQVKISHNCNISQKVSIGRHARLGYGVKIGNGSVIEYRAEIGEDVEIGDNCFIGKSVIVHKETSIIDNSQFYSNPLCIHGSRDLVYHHGPGHMGIGCKIFSIEDWERDIEDIGIENNYNPEEIEEYKVYLALVKERDAKVFPIKGEQ